MNEKIYHSLGRIGGANIALGIISIVTGVTVGILAIVTGAKLLKDKKHLLF